MAIVMGLDQHRAQITAEWIDTDTGELGRARISPALRGDVRRFFKRFAGQPTAPTLATWPSRPRRRRGAATRSGPRPVSLREAVVVERRLDALLPLAALIDQRVTQPDPGAQIEQMVGRDP